VSKDNFFKGVDDAVKDADNFILEEGGEKKELRRR